MYRVVLLQNGKTCQKLNQNCEEDKEFQPSKFENERKTLKINKNDNKVPYC